MTKHEFWDRAEAINAGMLAPMGSDRWVPMSHTADAAANRLWFITAKGTDIVDALKTGATPATYLLADNAKGLFAQVTGTLSLSDDRAKLKDGLEKILRPDEVAKAAVEAQKPLS